MNLNIKNSSRSIGYHETFDFEYTNTVYEDIIVEVDLWVQQGDTNCKDSDWDYKGELCIDNYRCFYNGKQIPLTVPSDLLYSEAHKHLRNLDVEDIIDNDGGCF